MFTTPVWTTLGSEQRSSPARMGRMLSQVRSTRIRDSCDSCTQSEARLRVQVASGDTFRLATCKNRAVGRGRERLQSYQPWTARTRGATAARSTPWFRSTLVDCDPAIRRGRPLRFAAGPRGRRSVGRRLPFRIADDHRHAAVRFVEQACDQRVAYILLAGREHVYELPGSPPMDHASNRRRSGWPTALCLSLVACRRSGVDSSGRICEAEIRCWRGQLRRRLLLTCLACRGGRPVRSSCLAQSAFIDTQRFQQFWISPHTGPAAVSIIAPATIRRISSGW